MTLKQLQREWRPGRPVEVDLKTGLPFIRASGGCANPQKEYVDRPYGAEAIVVACGSCWQCRQIKKRQVVGQMLAEAWASDHIYFATFTFRDCPEREIDLAHKQINPKFFQLLMKRLRFNSEGLRRIRYFAVAEKGSLKNRVHFHAVFFVKGLPFEWPHDERFHMAEWPHGFSHVNTMADERAMEYCAKYLTKEEGTDVWFSRSLKPALGTEFFLAKARRAAELGLPVPTTSFEYAPPASVREGAKYLMRGANRRDFILAFCDASGLDLSDLMVTANDMLRPVILSLEVDYRRRLHRDLPFAQFLDEFADEVERKGARHASEWLHKVHSGTAKAVEDRERLVNRLVDRGEYVPPELLPVPDLVTDPALHIPVRDADPPERRKRVEDLNRRRIKFRSRLRSLRRPQAAAVAKSGS